MGEQNVGSIVYTVRAETEGLVRGEQLANRSLDRLESGMDRTDKAAQRANTGLSTLAKAISAVVAASALRDMARLVQSYQEMAERVQMATTSQAEYEMVQKRLLATANGTYRSLAEAQELFIRTNASLQSLGYNTGQALDVMDSLSYSFVTNAASADRANAAISAVSKSFNTGKVAADQWQTITDAIPTIIEQIATSSKKSAEQVRALGAAGKLTARDLSEGLRQSLDANSQAAAKMSTNLTDAGVRMRTALQITLVALENQTGALQTFTNALTTAADMMIEFAGDAGNIETVMTAITLAVTSTAAIIAGRLVTSLAASGAAFYTNVVAARAKAAADLSAAQAAATAAAQELILAAAAEKAAVGLSTHAAAAARLTAAQATATAATTALGAAQQRMAGFATVAATAVGGLRAVLGFLGGPVGVALLAAGAVFAFASNAKSAKPPTDDLTKSVRDLTAAQRELAQFEASERLQKLGEDAKRLARDIEGANALMKRSDVDTGNDTFRRALVERRVELEKVNAEIVTYQKRLNDLNNYTPPKDSGGSGEPPPPSSPVDPVAARAAAKSIHDQIDALQLQADTLGMTETELELYKLQLAGASDEQIRAAASSRALIDAFEQQADAQKAAADAAAEAERRKTAQRAALGQADPIAGEQIRFEDQLASLKALNEAKLIEDQRYLDLKAQAERAHDEQMRALQEENYRRQSVANELLMASLDQLQQGATEALVGLVTGANNSEEAIRGLATSILKEAVGALVQMGIQYVKNQAIAAAAGAASTAQGVAQAATLTTAYAPAAAAASIASFGSAPAAGLAALAAALPAAIGLFSGGGRRYGGPVDAGSMYRVNENGRPEVFQAANGQQYMIPNQRGEVVSNENATGQNASPQVTVNLIEDRSRAGQVDQRRGDNGEDSISVFVANIRSGGEAASAIEQTFGVRRVGQ